jgi:hypothetical protein
VKNVVSRVKKAELNLKPPALPQLTPGLGKTCRNIFLLYKQIWYVPFFWTLTWYTYWILRAILFLNTPLTQVNPVNYTGAAISTTILLIAISRLGSDIRKVFFHDHFCAENNDASKALSKVKNSVKGIQMETSKPQKAQRSIRIHQPSNVSEREKLEPPLQGLMPPQSGTSALSSSVSYSDRHCVTQEISAECLTCANLISCKYRRCESVENQAQGSENSRCPFAMKLSTNKAVAS